MSHADLLPTSKNFFCITSAFKVYYNKSTPGFLCSGSWLQSMFVAFGDIGDVSDGQNDTLNRNRKKDNYLLKYIEKIEEKKLESAASELVPNCPHY